MDEMNQLRDDEIEGYIADCMATIKVLCDQNSPAADRVKASFIADMQSLLDLGRITPDEYNELTNEDNFSF